MTRALRLEEIEEFAPVGRLPRHAIMENAEVLEGTRQLREEEEIEPFLHLGEELLRLRVHAGVYVSEKVVLERTVEPSLLLVTVAAGRHSQQILDGLACLFGVETVRHDIVAVGAHIYPTVGAEALPPSPPTRFDGHRPPRTIVGAPRYRSQGIQRIGVPTIAPLTGKWTEMTWSGRGIGD